MVQTIGVNCNIMGVSISLHIRIIRTDRLDQQNLSTGKNAVNLPFGLASKCASDIVNSCGYKVNALTLIKRV